MNFRARRPPSMPVTVESSFHIRSRPITLGAAHLSTSSNYICARADCPRTFAIYALARPSREDKSPTELSRNRTVEWIRSTMPVENAFRPAEAAEGIGNFCASSITADQSA